MKIFSKKKSEPVAPPPVVSSPAKKDPKTETILKLDLPNVFAFTEDATKAKMNTRPAPGAVDHDAQPRLGRGRVILVESDDEVRRLVSRLLQHEGFQLATVTCLAEARERLKESAADFVLARRTAVPLNLQTEMALREIHKKAVVRIVDEFSDLFLGQVVDYESMAHASLGLADLLLSLLEGANTGVRGHAHTVAKYCRLVGQRLGLDRRALDGLTLAAYLHDLGALETDRSISTPTVDSQAARATSLQPTLDLLANIRFPYEINEILAASADNTVAKNSATESEADLPPIPTGARILRVVETYDTLRRAQGDEFPTEEAVFDWMRRQPTGTFDGDALETLVHIRKHEQAIHAMNLFWAGVLLVDPNPEELQLLRLRLENEDYQVMTAKTVEEALHKLRTEAINVVLTENSLDTPAGGFELLKAIKADPALRQIPVIFHAPADTDRIRQALELGAEDWYPKPLNVEIAAMKLQRIIGRMQAGPAAGDGVQGNLRELGLIEMVQILCAGGRSVQIGIENDGVKAELVIHNGNLISARHGQALGEPAALEILGWREGAFWIRPLKEAPPVSITASTDTLLSQRGALDQRRTTRGATTDE